MVYAGVVELFLSPLVVDHGVELPLYVRETAGVEIDVLHEIREKWFSFVDGLGVSLVVVLVFAVHGRCLGLYLRRRGEGSDTGLSA